ncbi:MAG: hypothetical protein NTY53_18990 [Kiritimatiellaeota bacterium]|nr:hypothetical protein [Kiritimatiellota bacterium]
MKISMRRLVAVAGATLSVLGFARAEWKDYGPFAPGQQRPKALAITNMTYTSAHSSQWDKKPEKYGEFTLPKEPTKGFTILSKSEDEAYMWLDMKPSGGQRQISFKVPGSSAMILEACAADLNGDGVLDFMLITGTAGCGINGDCRVVTFLLSSPTGYVARYVGGYNIEVTDLLEIGGRPVLMHGHFVFGEHGKDGLVHNYWVYNLLGFSGTEIVSANALERNFPKWIWYKFKPNHDATDQLTAKQKKRLWLAAYKDTWDDNDIGWVPLGRLLANEQR